MGERKTLLVTGGTGLLGKKLIALLTNTFKDTLIVVTYQLREPSAGGCFSAAGR